MTLESQFLNYGNIHNIVCYLRQPIPFTNGNNVSHTVALRMCCTSSPVESLIVYTHFTLRIMLLTFGNKTLVDVFPCPYNKEIADYNIHSQYLKSLLQCMLHITLFTELICPMLDYVNSPNLLPAYYTAYTLAYQIVYVLKHFRTRIIPNSFIY